MQTGWVKPNSIPPLQEGGVQVWRLDLDTPDRESIIAHAYRLLAPSEIMRAARMRAGLPRDEFVAGRGLVRLLLGHVALEFSKGAYGKPFLDTRGAPDFNLSHSQGIVLVGVSRSGDIGIDVEFVDPEFASTEELERMTSEKFFPTEVRMFCQRPLFEDRLLEFYTAWTEREAAAKMDGRGLTTELNLKGESSSRLPTVRNEVVSGRSVKGNTCFKSQVEVGVQHIASLALAKNPASINFFDAADLFTRGE